MPLGKITIDRRNIRTMKKDIILAQRQGVKPAPFKRERAKEKIDREGKIEEAEETKEKQIKQREEELRRAEEDREKNAQSERERKEQEGEEKRKKTEMERLGTLKVQQEQKKEGGKEQVRREEEKRKIEAQKKEEEIKQGEKKAEEVERKKEEIEERGPEYKKEVLLKEKEKIEEEKSKLRKASQKLAIEKKPLESQKELLLANIRKVEESFQIIASKEQKIEKKQKLIEEKREKAKTLGEKKQIEKERWKIENKRQELEKKRWPFGEKIEELEGQMNNIEIAVQKIEAKGSDLEERKKEIFEKEEKIRLRLEKIGLKQELIDLEKLEHSLAVKEKDFLIEIEKHKKYLNEILKNEDELKKEKILIEQEEKTAENLKKRREAEKGRWGVEERIRKVEIKKWDIEKTIQGIKDESGQAGKRVQAVSSRRNRINARIEEINQKLSIVSPERKLSSEIEEKKAVPAVSVNPAPVKKQIQHPKSFLPAAEKPEKGKPEREAEEIEERAAVVPEETFKKRESPLANAGEVAESEQRNEDERRMKEARKRIEALKESAREERGEREEQIRVAEERKREREEQKDEAERKKMVEEGKRRQELLQRLRENKKEIKKQSSPPQSRPQEIIRVLPRKPSSGARLWFRIVIVFVVIVILFGLATFWYWFFVVKKQSPIIITCANDSDCAADQVCGPEGACINAPPIAECFRDADCATDQVCGPEGNCVEKPPENAVPTALFLVDSVRTLEISSPEELRSLLSQTLNEWQNEGQFTRLVIKNSKNDTILGLKEFFEGLLMRAPEGFYQKVNNDFTLFIYSQTQGNRLGFVTKIKNYEGLENLLRNQEPTIENDFQDFFALMGKEGAAVVPYFRDALNVQGYTGPSFRYQTINNQDLGILYLTSGDYFLFTSSWKSMEEAIKRLEITGVRLELTTDLKRGDIGYEVKLLQSWLAQDAAVYPQAIINGLFGPKTESAVIRLQEKHASEILAPQGLVRGNGIVDSYTRIKLNELYGESGIKPRMTELITGLKIGSYGEEVKLLQTWLAEDKEIYPQAIISGYFGYLTQQALIRFQEKYMAEILTPQGLTEGTGVVDVLTRKKLNELYGKEQ